MQHGRECHILVTGVSQDLEITPSADGGEAPGFESLERGPGPRVRIGVMLPRGIARVGRIEFLAGSALVDTTDTEREEPFSVRPDEPRRFALLLKGKTGVRC